MIYAGIGARDAPEYYLRKIRALSEILENNNHRLRSGGAKGCDQTFMRSSNNAVIYKPWKGFDIGRTNPAWRIVEEPTDEAIDFACRYHNNRTPWVLRLHGRNTHIILGDNLKEKVDFCICYTLKGKQRGGTGVALRILEAKKIPTYNLGNMKFDEIISSLALNGII